MRFKVLIVTAFLSLAGFVACSSISKTGPYKGDQALYDADRTIVSSYDVLHSLVKWEYDNRQAVAQWPEIRQAADNVRANAQRWIQSAINLRQAYASDPNKENKSALQNALTVLKQALSEATRYMATPISPTGTNSPPASARPQSAVFIFSPLMV